MSGYTTRQAAKIAEQIRERFGSLVSKACENSVVPTFLLAGLIGVEAGKDRAGNLKPEATRFEKGVYEDLLSLRDNGFCYVGGKKRTTYSGIKRSQIQTASDADLRALATSYGLTQIMGWHVINNLKCTIADLRDPEKHLGYAVKLLEIVGGEYLRQKDFASVLRIWNTGSPAGKTYHASYVSNALAVAGAYRTAEGEKGRKGEREKENSIPIPGTQTPPTPEISSEVETSEPTKPVSGGGAGENGTVLCKERPSIFTRAWASIVAAVGAVTALGVNLTDFLNAQLQQLTIKHVAFLVVGLGISALGLWFYDRSAQRATRLNELKAENAANPNRINTEFR